MGLLISVPGASAGSYLSRLFPLESSRQHSHQRSIFYQKDTLLLENRFRRK